MGIRKQNIGSVDLIGMGAIKLASIFCLAEKTYTIMNEKLKDAFLGI